MYPAQFNPVPWRWAGVPEKVVVSSSKGALPSQTLRSPVVQRGLLQLQDSASPEQRHLVAVGACGLQKNAFGHQNSAMWVPY